MINTQKKYGLTIPQSKVKKPVITRSSVFGDDDEDEPINQAKAVRKIGTDPILKRKTQLEIDNALAQDPSVYEYDAIYDQIQEKKLGNQPEGKTMKDKDRKPKYIENLLKTAELRKKEFDRRVERTVQKERDAEQGQFTDKETFVTGAYRKKMQEMAEEEERERMQAELEAKLDVTKQKDLTGFYRHLLKQTTEDVEVSDSATVKVEMDKNKPVEKLSSIEVDFSADRDATDSESDSSDGSSDSECSRSKLQARRHDSKSPNELQHQSQGQNSYQSPERHNSRSLSPAKAKQKTLKNYRRRSRSSNSESDQSRSPERPHRSKTSKKNWHESRSPEKYRRRSKTPEKYRHRSNTSRKNRHRSRTPEKSRHRSRSPKKSRRKSRTPDRKRYRSRTPERHRSRHANSEDNQSNSRHGYGDKKGSMANKDDSRLERHGENRDVTLKEQSRSLNFKDDRSRSKSASREINSMSEQRNRSETIKNSKKDINKMDSKRISNDGNETKANEISVKFPKRNVGDCVEDARARYLARKQGRYIAIAADPDEKC